MWIIWQYLPAEGDAQKVTQKMRHFRITREKSDFFALHRDN